MGGCQPRNSRYGSNLLWDLCHVEPGFEDSCQFITDLKREEQAEHCGTYEWAVVDILDMFENASCRHGGVGSRSSP